MKYLILIHGNPASREIWESFTEAQQAEGYGVYAALTEELASSGELIVAEALADPSQARRLPARESLGATTDGPFPEAKEHLAGFFLVECESIERAVEIADRIPESPYGLVEVQPVLELGGQEM